MNQYFDAWLYICRTCGIDDKLFKIDHIPCAERTEEQLELNRNVILVTDAIIMLKGYMGGYSKWKFKPKEQVAYQGNLYTIKEVIDLKQKQPLQNGIIYAYVIERDGGMSIAYEYELSEVSK